MIRKGDNISVDWLRPNVFVIDGVMVKYDKLRDTILLCYLDILLLNDEATAFMLLRQYKLVSYDVRCLLLMTFRKYAFTGTEDAAIAS